MYVCMFTCVYIYIYTYIQMYKNIQLKTNKASDIGKTTKHPQHPPKTKLATPRILNPHTPNPKP